MGDRRTFRHPASLRSQLQAFGGTEAIRAACKEIIAGPPKATARDWALALGKLTLHYWAPDFTPEQAREKYGDFIRLLDGLTASEVRDACDQWSMDATKNWFPRPGNFHEMVKDRLRDRAVAKTGAEYLLTLLDAAPESGERGGNVGKQLEELSNKLRVSR